MKNHLCILVVLKDQIWFQLHKKLHRNMIFRFCECGQTYCNGYNFICICGEERNHHCPEEIKN